MTSWFFWKQCWTPLRRTTCWRTRWSPGTRCSQGCWISRCPLSTNYTLMSHSLSPGPVSPVSEECSRSRNILRHWLWLWRQKGRGYCKAADAGGSCRRLRWGCHKTEAGPRVPASSRQHCPPEARGRAKKLLDFSKPAAIIFRVSSIIRYTFNRLSIMRFSLKRAQIPFLCISYRPILEIVWNINVHVSLSGAVLSHCKKFDSSN